MTGWPPSATPTMAPFGRDGAATDNTRLCRQSRQLKLMGDDDHAEWTRLLWRCDED